MSNLPRPIRWHTPKIGLFGIGIDADRPQFAGLKERLEGDIREVEEKLSRPEIEIFNLGLVDTPEKACEASIDDASFHAMGDRTRMTGEWLAHCGACPVPETANVFNRAHRVLPVQRSTPR